MCPECGFGWNSKPIKSGTKDKHIRIAEGDQNTDCNIGGCGAMPLNSEIEKVKQAVLRLLRLFIWQIPQQYF